MDSPFDYDHHALLYLPPEMPDPGFETEDYRLEVAKVAREILKIIEGGAFVLFTNYSLLHQTYEELKREFRGMKLYRQGDKPRYKLIEEFKRGNNSVLFGTYTFWQGIDVPGKALQCVIITKLPFAVPDDPITEAKLERLSSQNKNPFIHYQLPQAIILLKQGFGRLIRTKEDMGMVAILDPRIKTRYYGRMFLNSLPRCPQTHSLNEVRDFFSQMGRQEEDEFEKPILQCLSQVDGRIGRTGLAGLSILPQSKD